MWKRFEKEAWKRRIRASFFVQPVLEWRTDSGREKDEGVFGDFFVSVGYSCDSVVVLQMPRKRKEVWRRGRYPLLVLHGAAGIFGFLNSLGIGPEGFFFACWILTLLLAEEFFLSRVDPLGRKEQADFWKEPEFLSALFAGLLSGEPF